MFGLSIPDLIVLLLYFVGIKAIGVWTRKKIKSSGDFFMANRRFGKLMMVAQAFGAGTHTDQPVSVGGALPDSNLLTAAAIPHPPVRVEKSRQSGIKVTVGLFPFFCSYPGGRSR